MNRRLFRILLDPEPADKTGGKAETPPPAPDFEKLIAEAVKKHGSSDAAFRAVLAERDQAVRDRDEARTRLPKEGSVVLDADGAKAWGAYQALGDPSALAKAIEAGTDAATERDDLKFKSHIGEVSGLMKWKPGVLADRVKASGIETTIKEESDPRDPKKKVPVAHVKLEGDKTTPLADYAKEHWADYLPALSAEPAKPEVPRGSPSSHGHAPPRPAVVNTDQPRRSFVS